LLQVIDRSDGLVAWMNGRNADTIAILNEWHRLFPQEDPLAVHERLWGTRPLCVGGGTFRWNDTWMTMESSVLGHDFNEIDAPALPAALDHLGVITTSLSFDEIPNAPRNAGALAPGEQQVDVKAGDTWFSLAGDHGVNANALARRNQAQVNDAPAAGRQVIIPRWDSDRTRSVGLRVRVSLRAADKSTKPVSTPAAPKAPPIP
jgi:LysM repeat protein